VAGQGCRSAPRPQQAQHGFEAAGRMANTLAGCLQCLPPAHTYDVCALRLLSHPVAASVVRRLSSGLLCFKWCCSSVPMS